MENAVKKKYLLIEKAKKVNKGGERKTQKKPNLTGQHSFVR